MRFKPLKKLETYLSQKERHQIDLTAYSEGVHSTPQAFFKKEADGSIPWVVSRICDHAGGKLVTCPTNPQKAICPLHNWEFDFESLAYTKIPNQSFVHIKKTPLPYSIEGTTLTYETEQLGLRVPDDIAPDKGKPCHAVIRHITHASVSMALDEITFVTDPWYVGECLGGGWWLKHPPKDDCWELLEKADFLYISHNHPDHMHRETLDRVARDKPIIVPHFETDSVAAPLEHVGFTQVIELELMQLYQVSDSDMLISILPTGDHRDDSALYVAKRDFSAVFTVDCVGANQYILPQDISLLLTNFASGASGWPLCWDVVGPMEERDKIVTKNRGNAMVEVMKYIALTRPKAYLPYAGYFDEKAPRDAEIQAHNTKNSPEQTVAKVKQRFPAVFAINPIAQDVLEYRDGEFTASTIDRPPLSIQNEAYINAYLDRQKTLLRYFDIEKVAEYFCLAEFQDDLILYLVMTDDAYEPIDQGLRIDFSTSPISYQVIDSAKLMEAFNALGNLGGLHHTQIRARKDSLWHLVFYGLPLEELSLGFQCRIDRKPDQYNAKFWKHYTTFEAPSLKRGEDRLLYKLLTGTDEL